MSPKARRPTARRPASSARWSASSRRSRRTWRSASSMAAPSAARWFRSIASTCGAARSRRDAAASCARTPAPSIRETARATWPPGAPHEPRESCTLPLPPADPGPRPAGARAPRHQARAGGRRLLRPRRVALLGGLRRPRARPHRIRRRPPPRAQQLPRHRRSPHLRSPRKRERARARGPSLSLSLSLSPDLGLTDPTARDAAAGAYRALAHVLSRADSPPSPGSSLDPDPSPEPASDPAFAPPAPPTS